MGCLLKTHFPNIVPKKTKPVQTSVPTFWWEKKDAQKNKT